MITSKNQNINIVFFLILLLFPFIQQRSYGDLPQSIRPIVEGLYKYYSLLSATIIYGISLNLQNIIKNRRLLSMIIVFWGIYIISTLFNCPEEIVSVLYRTYIHIALVLLVIIGCKKWTNEFLSAASIVYGGWIIMTLITSFLFSGGLYKVNNYHSAHLLGDDNALAYVMLPGLVILSVKSMIRKEKIDLLTWGIIILVLLLLIQLWAASGMISVMMFTFLLFLSRYINIIKGKWLFRAFIIVVIITLFGLSNPYVTNIIENYIEKEVTLTGRTILWAGAINMISVQPILGYGGYFKFGLFSLGRNAEYPCHTPYLQLMIDGGLLLFATFFVLVNKAYTCSDKDATNKSGIILVAGLFCMMLNYITEHSGLLHFFIITTMLFNIDSLKGIEPNGYTSRNRK